MPEKKAVRVKKQEGGPRKPKLAGLFKESTSIFASVGGKEIEAKVHADGVIHFKNKEFTSPSAAGKLARGGEVNGWIFWSVKKDGELVTLAALTGRKIKATAKPKREKKAVAAKPKAKRVRKTATKKVEEHVADGESLEEKQEEAIPF